jgi:hypothetical protein
MRMKALPIDVAQDRPLEILALPGLMRTEEQKCALTTPSFSSRGTRRMGFYQVRSGWGDGSKPLQHPGGGRWIDYLFARVSHDQACGLNFLVLPWEMAARLNAAQARMSLCY